ncbi:MAG: hypothetical protein QM704_25175 [Anaeromyxobacteraceae bacterium]
MQPRVRARHMKNLLAAIDRMPSHDRDPVHARIAVTTGRTVQDASAVDWLPAQVNLEVTRAVFAGLGPEGGARFFRGTMRDAFTGPLLRIITDAARRVLRLDPASFAGWVGTGWTLVFRDCGRWTVQRAGSGEAHVRLEELAPEYAKDRIWLASHAASFEAFFDVAATVGSVVLQEVEASHGRALYVIRWRV